MSSKNVIAVDDRSFDEQVLNSDKPVLIKFSTRACAPCRTLAPTVDRIADELEGRWRVFSVDVDDAPRVATRYMIRSVPTLLAFAGGAPRGQLVGVQSREAILKLLG
jgi:thioredoxin 1